MQTGFIILIIVVLIALLYYGDNTTKKWSFIALVVVGALIVYFNFIAADNDLNDYMGGRLKSTPEEFKQKLNADYMTPDMYKQKVAEYWARLPEYKKEHKFRNFMGFAEDDLLKEMSGATFKMSPKEFKEKLRCGYKTEEMCNSDIKKFWEQLPEYKKQHTMSVRFGTAEEGLLKEITK